MQQRSRGRPFLYVALVVAFAAGTLLTVWPAAADEATPTGDTTPTDTTAPPDSTTTTTPPDTTAPTSTTTTTTPPTTTSSPPPAGALDVGAQATRTLTVSPSTDLQHLTSVAVTGTGFTPNADIGIAQCRATGTLSIDGCDLGNVALGHTNGAGTFVAQLSVRAKIATAGGLVDCRTAPGTCMVGAARIDSPNYSENAIATISFDPNAALPPPPTITVDPSSGLHHGDVVTVTGSGFEPHDFVGVEQCVAGSGPCGNGGFAFAQADDAGNVVIDVRVSRVIGELGAVPYTDCLTTACVLRLTTTDPLGNGEEAISFADEPLPAPAVLTVSPATALWDRQIVTVSGTGFAPNLFLTLVQCRTGSTLADYDCNFLPSVQTNAGGGFSTTAALRRFIPAAPGRIDCAIAGACTVIAFSYEDLLSIGMAGLQFDPNAPLPPPPVVALSQSTGLVDGQVVTVSGSGFSPNTSIGVSQCEAGAVEPVNCDVPAAKFVQSDSTGSFSSEFTLHEQIHVGSSVFAAPPGVVDCGSAPGTCMLGVANLGDYSESAGVALTFGYPDAPSASSKAGGGGAGGAGTREQVDADPPAATDPADPPGPDTQTQAAAAERSDIDGQLASSDERDGDGVLGRTTVLPALAIAMLLTVLALEWRRRRHALL